VTDKKDKEDKNPAFSINKAGFFIV